MKKAAFITGANQGLGFALTEALCKTLGDDWVVYLGARNIQRGKEAVKKLQEKGLAPVFHQVDVTDEASVSTMAAMLKEKHDGVDLFISNAAARITRETPQSEQVATFINTNNHGSAHRIITHIAPLLRAGSRFLMVASSFGSLTQIPASLHNRFDVENASLDDIEQVLDEYVTLMRNGTAKEQGWPEWINVPSKIGQVASTKILAREMRQRAEAENIMICAICPGLMDTEASRPWFDDMSFAKSPEDAVEEILPLATQPEWQREYYGELVQYRKVIPWK